MEAFITKNSNIFVKGYGKACVFNKNKKLLSVTTTDEFDYIRDKHDMRVFDIKNSKRIRKALIRSYRVKNLLIRTLNIEPCADFCEKHTGYSSFVNGVVDRLMNVELSENDVLWNGHKGSISMENELEAYLKKSKLYLIN